jgi:hypothetical protein
MRHAPRREGQIYVSVISTNSRHPSRRREFRRVLFPEPCPLSPGPVSMSSPLQPAVHAPDFPANLDWINTGGRRLSLTDLRGKIVLLDFWTYG